MRLATSSALAALALTLSVGLARAETVWVGNFFVSVTPPTVCGNTASKGDTHRVTYRPAGAALGNGADSYLAVIGQRANFTMLVPNNTFAAGINYAARYVSSYLNFGSNTGAITAWSMAPAALATNSTRAELQFTFTNFYAITGCTVTLRGDLERVP